MAKPETQAEVELRIRRVPAKPEQIRRGPAQFEKFVKDYPGPIAESGHFP